MFEWITHKKQIEELVRDKNYLLKRHSELLGNVIELEKNDVIPSRGLVNGDKTTLGKPDFQLFQNMEQRLMKKNRKINVLDYWVDELCCRVRYLENTIKEQNYYLKPAGDRE